MTCVQSHGEETYKKKRKKEEKYQRGLTYLLSLFSDTCGMSFLVFDLGLSAVYISLLARLCETSCK